MTPPTNGSTPFMILAPNMDMVLVIGSLSSGNSHRLRDIAREHCGKAYLIDSPDDIDWSWFDGCRKVGITAGASTPSFSVEQILKALHDKIGIDLAQFRCAHFRIQIICRIQECSIDHVSRHVR